MVSATASGGKFVVMTKTGTVLKTALSDEIPADCVLWTKAEYVSGPQWHPGPAHAFSSGLPVANPTTKPVQVKKPVRKKQEPPTGMDFDNLR